MELGKILGAEERASATVERVRDEVQCLREAVLNLEPKRVLLQVGANPIFVSVPGTFTDDVSRQ